MASNRQDHFQSVLSALPRWLDELMAAPASPRASHQPIPNGPGIYCFSENGQPLYVGQTRKLRTRLRQHTSPTASHYSATFAYRLAVEAAEQRGVPVNDTRGTLSIRADFAPLFTEAKNRVANMDVRFMVMRDPIERTIFEVYAALHLGTEHYNSFETH